MWTEARKQERRLRGMMVDYKKRAERRREYYDRIKTDPAQFMQVGVMLILLMLIRANGCGPTSSM